MLVGSALPARASLDAPPECRGRRGLAWGASFGKVAGGEALRRLGLVTVCGE